MADYTDVATVRKLGEIDPELTELLKTYTPPVPTPGTSTADLRALQLETDIKRANATRPETIREYTREIPMRDGYISQIRIIEPSNTYTSTSTATSTPSSSLTTPSYPLVTLFFGGGFIMGNNHQLLPYAYILSTLLSAVIVLPAYRLAPENPFPAGPNDAIDTLSWLATHSAEIHAAPSKGFVVGGVSAGANLACVAVQLSVSKGMTPPVTGLWLNIPSVMSEISVPEAERHLYLSRTENVDGKFGLNAESIERFTRAYNADYTSQLSSPFNVPNAHGGMPPTYFQIAGADPLRDDGLIYERALRENGVKTRMEVYPGVPHGHFATFPQLRQSGKSHFDTVVGVAWLLGKELRQEVVVGALRGMAPPANA